MDEEIHALVAELKSSSSTKSPLYDVHVNNLIASMLDFDEPTFEKVLSNSIVRLGVFEAMMNVIYPFLRKTGVLWSTNNATPAQEHFASNLLKRKLHVALDNLHYPKNDESKFLLFLPPDEHHEIGLLLTNYIIRERGRIGVYLGPDVPYESLKAAIKHIAPGYLITFLITGTNSDRKLEELFKIAKNKKMLLLVCSNEPCSDKIKVPRNVRFLTKPDDIFQFLGRTEELRNRR